jgi:putative iron-regulated protein
LNQAQTEWTSPRDASAGQRPWTDYAQGEACTSGPAKAPARICERRGQYLVAVTELLTEDLERVAKAWDPAGGNNHYTAFAKGDELSLAKILESMGRLGFGELAGERINIALLTNSQEDEHSCFSDNTHRDIYLNAQGIHNSYLGRYQRVDGSVVQGPGVYDLLKVKDAALADRLKANLDTTMQKAAVIDERAKGGMPFDQQVQLGIDEPNIHAVIDALVAQTEEIESAIKVLGLTTSDLRQDTEQQL